MATKKTTKKTAPAPAAHDAAPAKTGKTVRVKVRNAGGIKEDEYHACGEVFETTADRAKALGDLVEPA